MGNEQIEASDWTDVDLLTRDEAVERLDAEIADVSAELAAELAAKPDAEPDAGSDAGDREYLTQRLDALRRMADELRGRRDASR